MTTTPPDLLMPVVLGCRNRTPDDNTALATQAGLGVAKLITFT